MLLRWRFIKSEALEKNIIYWMLPIVKIAINLVKFKVSKPEFFIRQLIPQTFELYLRERPHPLDSLNLCSFVV